MAFVSPKMGLRVWNSDTDRYDHEQLAYNFLKLDQHDHSSTKGQQIPTAGLADGAVTLAKLASGVYPYAVNASVGNTVTSQAITLGTAQPNTSYTVFVTPNWNTTTWVTNKTTGGFTIHFGTASGASNTLDWLIVR